MNFLKNSIKTIGNAVEINNLKDERTKLNKEKTEFEERMAKYDNLISLKKILENNIQTNDVTIGTIMQNFILLNIKVEQNETTESFCSQHKDEYIVKMYKLLNSLTITNKSLHNMVNEINPLIQIDKSTYQNKIEEINKKLDKVNEKLKAVREKQFQK